MAGLFHLWNQWEVQILVLVSFAVQVFLLTFAGMRWCNIPPVLRIILWLMYLFADSIAVYTLGHMSISYKPDEHRQFMALWASLLLVHLGGQDTITAYAMEDNNLWLRHMFTLVMQAVGAVYVLYKYILDSEAMFMAAAMLMFAVGVIKYGERVWSLKSANMDSVGRFLDRVKMEDEQGTCSAHTQVALDAEVVLQASHDLIYICMGQFVDYNVWPSQVQCEVLKFLGDNKGKMYELIEKQLSLMYDVFYTKALVIHTWHGICIRIASLLGTVTAFFLFQFSAASKHDGYNRVDTNVTYVLLIGACLLEVASVLRTLVSTWTCAALKARRKLGWLHCLLVSLRRLVKAAQITRRWSGSIGQHNLVDSFSDKARLISRVVSLFTRGNSITISSETKMLVLDEIVEMVKACRGDEERMRSYRGLNGERGRELEVITAGMEFDERILTWHFATDVFLHFYKPKEGEEELVEATKVVSNYMMYLLVEHPYMLPSPVRARLYASARPAEGDIIWGRGTANDLFQSIKDRDPMHPWDPTDPQNRDSTYGGLPKILGPGAKLGNELLKKQGAMEEVIKDVFEVWVEKLSYAAHHCSRDSHARQLNSGGEFITVVWLLTSAVFKKHYSDEDNFKKNAKEFFNTLRSTDYDKKGLCERLCGLPFTNFYVWLQQCDPTCR
ncbi:hypothetical protein BS78_07G024000 [Paspalum vaginatum]|nr:hypothetical protein BS78_07G024000 [Paspalum vaginatum]